MRNEKEIQAKIDELQKGVDALENLLIKTEDAKVRESYMQTRKDVQQDIRTLEWVLSIANVVGQSEQLCQDSIDLVISEPINYCDKCGKYHN